jgi:HJR/Mrr/RecB family endonuclease
VKSASLKGQVITWLMKEMKSKKAVSDFSNTLRSLNICDLKDDEQLERVATTGAINTLVAMYQMGILSKLIQVQNIAQGE